MKEEEEEEEEVAVVSILRSPDQLQVATFEEVRKQRARGEPHVASCNLCSLFGDVMITLCV